MSETIANKSTDEVEAGDSLNVTQEENENAVPEEEPNKDKLLKLPLARVKTISKYAKDPAFHSNAEATFLIAKSTELFIESLVSQAYKSLGGSEKRRVIIHKRDIDNVVETVDSLTFLDEMLN